MSDDNNGSGNFVIWIISVVITLFIGYTWGSGSKQPLIDSQNQQITALTAQVSSLSITDTTTPEPTTVYTPEPVSTKCAITTCNDGSCSSSTGRGTCSWHGGVDHY